MIQKSFKIFLFSVLIWLAANEAAAFFQGEVQNFYIDSSYDASGRSNIQATLRHIGDKAVFYVENEWWDRLDDKVAVQASLVALSVEFDRVIYPRLTKIYGSEWIPGIDNELRIAILLSPMGEGAGGYFNSSDEFPRARAPRSNEREMVYLNTLYLNRAAVKGYLAHEFQHLISFYQKEKLRGVQEEVWLNEARSEYALTLAGYDDTYRGSHLERRVNEFLRNSSDSLTEWQNEPSDYGPVNLFMQYLGSRYGQLLVSEMMKAEAAGLASINSALAKIGSGDRFVDIFTNWAITNYVNDCQLGESFRFCYLNPTLSYERLHIRPTTSNFLPAKEGLSFSFSDKMKDWAARWYEIILSPSGLNLILSFKGSASTNFQVPYLIYRVDGSRTLNYLKLDGSQQGAEMILAPPSAVKGVVLVPFNQTKTAGFSASEPNYEFSYTVKLTSETKLPPALAESPTPAVVPQPTNQSTATPAPKTLPNFPDGSLIRARGDDKVYVISGRYKRWLQTPAVLAVYPHLGWQSIIEVTPAERDFYRDAWLIRAEGDYRVYEINGDFSKHWLNMNAEEFSRSGRVWEGVFVVNKAERDLYVTGAEVLK